MSSTMSKIFFGGATISVSHAAETLKDSKTDPKPISADQEFSFEDVFTYQDVSLEDGFTSSQEDRMLDLRERGIPEIIGESPSCDVHSDPHLVVAPSHWYGISNEVLASKRRMRDRADVHAVLAEAANRSRHENGNRVGGMSPSSKGKAEKKDSSCSVM